MFPEDIFDGDKWILFMQFCGLITKTLLPLIIILLAVSSCKRNGSLESTEVDVQSTLFDESGWRRMACGLYQDSTGEIGYAPHQVTANVSSDLLEDCPIVFLTYIGSSGEKKLGSVVDTSSFEQVGGGFFKDKSNIYLHYDMCDGGYFNIFAEDTSTFKVLGCCYAFYKSKIYHSRNGLMNADAETFRTTVDLGPVAKDQHGYFSFEERISADALRKELGQKLFTKLEQL